MSAANRQDDSTDAFALPSDERYLAFVADAVREGQVWTLKDAGGFIAFSDDEGRDCFPFWPSAACARALATDDWSGCEPEALPLDVFMERWLIGMARDGRLVAVFPAVDGTGVVIEPKALLDDLHDAQLH
jgi:hypothetical protein